MKLRKSIFIFGTIGVFLVSVSCQRESGEKTFKVPPLIGSEVNVEKIQENLECQFDILKAETVGYSPTHKFLWVCVETEADSETVQTLAQAVIDDIIEQKPSTYHSFTIHFLRKGDLHQTVESSYSFAKAEYLPQGGWVQVGRMPINQYQNYELSCIFKEP